MSNLLGQQNGLASFGMNNHLNASLGNFAGLGGNFGGGNLGASLGGSNFGGINTQNTNALLQQLIASQGQNNSQASAQGNRGVDGGGDAASGNKRSLDDAGGDGEDGGPSKKQQTVSL